MSKYVRIVFIILLITSCHKKLLVNKDKVIVKSIGLAVFVDREASTHKNSEKGDLYIDSLLPDFFIPYKFTNKIISETEIDKALLHKNKSGISFFYLKGDCNEILRTSYIGKESLHLKLEKNIDGYLESDRIFILPVEIEYLKGAIDREYYELHKSLILYYKNATLEFGINKGYLDVLRLNVFEGEWMR